MHSNPEQDADNSERDQCENVASHFLRASRMYFSISWLRYGSSSHLKRRVFRMSVGSNSRASPPNAASRKDVAYPSAPSKSISNSSPFAVASWYLGRRNSVRNSCPEYSPSSGSRGPGVSEKSLAIDSAGIKVSPYSFSQYNKVPWKGKASIR